jgi:hypothetical protein
MLNTLLSLTLGSQGVGNTTKVNVSAVASVTSCIRSTSIRSLSVSFSSGCTLSTQPTRRHASIAGIKVSRISLLLGLARQSVMIANGIIEENDPETVENVEAVVIEAETVVIVTETDMIVAASTDTEIMRSVIVEMSVTAVTTVIEGTIMADEMTAIEETEGTATGNETVTKDIAIDVAARVLHISRTMVTSMARKLLA